MSGIVSFLNILHLVLTAGFVVVTFALLGVSILNRMRIRNTILTWRPGAWRTLPYGPIFFALLITGFEAIALLSGRGIPVHLLAGYGAGSVAWFLASYISSVVVVSECGIIADVHRRDASVAWGRISDYFEFNCGRRRGFVFLHRDDRNDQRRLEVEVPDSVYGELADLVDMQLRRRFETADRRAQGKTALEG